MESITLKELSAYLPYGVNCNLTRFNFWRTNVLLLNFELSYSSTFKNYHIRIANVTYGLEDIKLHLRPLSYITKKIEVNGEMFYPIDRIKQSQHHLFFREDIDDALSGLQYSEINKLLEWHFDVFGLIDRGLASAIDLSDVNPNDLDDI